MPNCSDCGTEVQATDKFCRQCGKILKVRTGETGQPIDPSKNAQLPPKPELAALASNPYDINKPAGPSGATVQQSAEKAKPTPEEIVEFYKWRQSVKTPSVAPQPAVEFAKSTAGIQRDLRNITKDVKQELTNAMKAPAQPSAPAANIQPAAPKLTPEEMTEFKKWQQAAKGTS